VKNYHREGGKPRCAVKVNLMKAYDSVDWNFILQYLLCVDTGLECITTPKFSIALNDTLVGYFEGKKGLRQGDPISPYLFVLAMEVFSRLLEEASLKDKAFQFHPGYAAIKLADLWFGDDLLLFSWASCKLFRVCFSLRLQKFFLQFWGICGVEGTNWGLFTNEGGVSDCEIPGIPTYF
jgi:hypothetical protein